MKKQRLYQSKEFITLETLGGSVFYFDIHKLLTYSLKLNELTVILVGGYELPKAKDAAEIEKFIEQINRIR
jgi:hypothetical protein